jgi:hypothetical protein
MMASSVDFGTGTAARVAAGAAATTPLLLRGCGRQFLPVAADCHCAADVPWHRTLLCLQLRNRRRAADLASECGF